VGEYAANIIDDGLVLAQAVMGFTTHYDLYNGGIILGRSVKILIALYLEGWIYKNV